MKIAKQILVMRTKFPGEVGVRKGKLVAQGSHASMKAVLDKMTKTELKEGGIELSIVLEPESALMEWVMGRFTKVCLGANQKTSELQEKELIEYYEQAKAKGIPCSLITDAGLTEFGGNPTITSCSIGPAWSDEIDTITQHLSPL